MNCVCFFFKYYERDSPGPAPPGIPGPTQKKASNIGSSNATPVASKKKVKRRSGRVNDREKERSASPQEIPIDPDEPTYCLCDQVCYFLHS